MDLLKLKATTLVETLAAMIIVTISIVIVWQVFLFADIGNKTLLKTKAEIIAQDIHANSCIQMRYENQIIETKNFLIEVDYSPLFESPHFLLEEIKFLHLQSGKELFQFQFYLRKQ